MEMKIKRQAKFGEALDEITRFAETLRSGTTEIGGRTLSLDDEVEFHIEFEAEGDALELEFEVKWAAASSDGSGSEENIIPQEEVWEANKGSQASAAKEGVPKA